MNGTGDIPLAHTATPERPCGLTSIIPSLGMSSCRGRAEAFARSLQSKLRTLGTQNDELLTNSHDHDQIVNTNGTSNPWLSSPQSQNSQTVTDIQPPNTLCNEIDSLFDFECELESPGSPAEECEYIRLIDTASTTPRDHSLSSGFLCASTATEASAESSSSEDPFFDPETSDSGEQRSQVTSDFYDCESESDGLTNGFENHINDAKITSNGVHNENESLPSADTVDSASSIPSHHEIQDAVLSELLKHSQDCTTVALLNGHHHEADVERSIDREVTEHHMQNGLRSSSEHDKESSEQKVDRTEDNAQTEEIQKPTADEPAPCKEPEPEKQRSVGRASSEEKHLSGLDTEDDDDCRPQRVRRCSSLKTGKTPPGTPGRKKFVRFADVLGLDLADVKTFLDEVPNIPKSAFEDLECLEQEPPIQLGPKAEKILMPLFQQPGGLPLFLDLVREKQVCLENAAVTDHLNLTITGSVRVRNLDFNKSVHIRYTLDGWRSFADLQANYVQNSCDGFSDKFSFVLFGNSMVIGQRLEFAVRFHCKGQQYWDNNFGANYCFQCLPATNSISAKPPQVLSSTTHNNTNAAAILSPVVGEPWCNSFY